MMVDNALLRDIARELDRALKNADYPTAGEFDSCADITPVGGGDVLSLRKACVYYAPGESSWEFTPRLVVRYGPQGGDKFVLEGYSVELQEDDVFYEALRERLTKAIAKAVSEAEQDVWEYLLRRALDSIARKNRECRYDENSDTMVCDFSVEGNGLQSSAEYRLHFR